MKPFSKKSDYHSAHCEAYPAFVCVINPSRVHRLLLILVCAASVLAIVISQIPMPLQIALASVLVWAGCLRWRDINHCINLYHHGGPDDTANRWIVVKDGVRHEGKLVSRGYRSARLLILALQPENKSRLYRLPVWADSVSSEQFSYLNLQLMFNSERAPGPR